MKEQNTGEYDALVDEVEKLRAERGELERRVGTYERAWLAEHGRACELMDEIAKLRAEREGVRKPLFAEIETERQRQDAKWGEQNHPIRVENNALFYKSGAECFKRMCNERAAAGTLTWHVILMEEVYEAFAEDTTNRQREELVQVAAVVVAMIECIDRRAALAEKGE